MKKELSKEELKLRLTPEQYKVTQEEATEKPFSGKYDDWNEEGTYTCICCGAKLFSSESKFDAGCGWPSFSEPEDNNNVGEKQDERFAMKRTEVHCENYGTHLGHIFNDGPRSYQVEKLEQARGIASILLP